MPRPKQPRLSTQARALGSGQIHYYLVAISRTWKHSKHQPCYTRLKRAGVDIDIDIGTRVFVFEAGLAIIIIGITIRGIDGAHCSCWDAGPEMSHSCREMRLVKDMFGPIDECE
jgi:hypothetical protein